MDYVQLVMLVCQAAGVIAEEAPAVMAMIDRMRSGEGWTLEELEAVVAKVHARSKVIQGAG